ncbi:hypothetical protein M569_00902, partial [Genlisea aurea]
LNAAGGDGGFELSRYLFLGSLLLSREGGGMDLSKVGEKIVSSVRSARSLGLLPSLSDRPEVPERAAAAAALARVLAGLPPHQRHNLPTTSEELSTIFESNSQKQPVDELEPEFYEEDFDPVRHVLEHIHSDENDQEYFEEKAALRLVQLDRISENLSRHVMEHHEEMVNGMNLVRELERDLKIATVICMNGRRHLISSKNEVYRDLVVNERSKKKQALLDLLPILTELHHAVNMQATLETCVEEGAFTKAFQVLPEYLQLLNSLSGLSAVQDLTRGVEVWLGKTLQRLDLLLFEICRDFKEDAYLTVVDAHALIDDVSGLAEKIQSFFMQEVISESHSALRTLVQEVIFFCASQNQQLTFSDLCTQIPESKFRRCLLSTLAALFKVMCSYYAVMSFHIDYKVSFFLFFLFFHGNSEWISENTAREVPPIVQSKDESVPLSLEVPSKSSTSTSDPLRVENTPEARDNGNEASSSGSPWFILQKGAVAFVSHALQRGRRNLWQLTTSRVAVLLSSPVVGSTSIHQFLKIYEDLIIFILAGEAFCGTEAIDFRQKLRSVCESYFASFHRQNIYALKMVMEKETWQIMPPHSINMVSFPGLIGDGAALIVSCDSPRSIRSLHDIRMASQASSGSEGGFSYWQKNGNPFLASPPDVSKSGLTNGLIAPGTGNTHKMPHNMSSSPGNLVNGTNFPEDENDDLHADFIDEDSQLPSRVFRPGHSRNNSSHGNEVELATHTASSLSLLKFMDKYARLMQKLEIVNIEFFKGLCHFFEIFFLFVFESFSVSSTQSSGKVLNDSLPHKLKNALSRISQDCDQWLKPVFAPSFASSSTPMSSSFALADVTPTSPPIQLNHNLLGLAERCAGADNICLVAQLLIKSKSHLQVMLLQKNRAAVDDFFANLVGAVPELIQHIHRTTAKLLLHMNGYVERISNAKWEVKELGLEHNGYVDLLLGEFKHFKTRIAHGGIRKEVQDILLEYGIDNIAETLIEGLSRVKRCTDEGRALMSLDLQVLINGLKHLVPIDVKQKLQVVETFIKAYYLPETEFVHWSRTHPVYTKNQVVGLINLVATMKGWKRKSRLETLERIE